MRTLADRLRHTLLFEGIALIIVSPTVAWIFNTPITATASMTISLSLIAMLWNGIYNWLFDLLLLKLNKPLYPRSAMLRLAHTVLFEMVLIVVSLPIIVDFLKVGFVEALIADLGFSAFFMVYAYIYNWSYDLVFPVKERITSA